MSRATQWWAWLACTSCGQRVAVDYDAYRAGSYACCGREAEWVRSSKDQSATDEWVNRCAV